MQRRIVYEKENCFFLSIIMILGLAGCGKNQTNIKEADTSDNNEQMVQNIYENKEQK